MSRFPRLAVAFAVLATAVSAESFDLGRPATEGELSAWDIDVRPDGLGLPDGSGDVPTGEEIYSERCAECHGDFGEGIGRWPAVAGGQGTLTRPRPVRTIGSYWPYLSTVWDYVHRAMPYGAAQTLTTDETYAVTAYLLYLNDLVEYDFVLSRENFIDVRLPNEANFMDDDRAAAEFPEFAADPCMTGCKGRVEITMRAQTLDVTPEGARAADLGETAEAARENNAPEQMEEEEPSADVSPDPALVAVGKGVFRRCAACHQVGDGARNRVGPVLNGIVGRAAGQAKGFRYSPALGDAAAGGLIWTPDNLRAFLASPRDFLKGTRMSFAGLTSEKDIEAVIAYLKSSEE